MPQSITGSQAEQLLRGDPVAASPTYEASSTQVSLYRPLLNRPLYQPVLETGGAFGEILQQHLQPTTRPLLNRSLYQPALETEGPIEVTVGLFFASPKYELLSCKEEFFNIDHFRSGDYNEDYKEDLYYNVDTFVDRYFNVDNFEETLQ